LVSHPYILPAFSIPALRSLTRTDAGARSSALASVSTL
jgi:hypothetical protein